MRAKLVKENISFNRAETEDAVKKKLFPKVLKAVKRLINSVWTVEYRLLGDNKVEILKFGRDDEEGYEREHELPKGDITEDDDRIARSLNIWSSDDLGPVHSYTIANPKHIFSYR